MGMVKAVVGGVAVLGLLGYMFGGDDSDPDSADPNASAPTPASSAPTQEETKPFTPDERLQDAVDDSDADKPTASKTQKFLLVQFKVKEGWDAGNMQAGVAIDVFDMAERIVKADVPLNKVMFTGTYPLVDKYGNEDDGDVFRATFSMGTLKKLKYDNIDTTSMDLVEDLATGSVYRHQDLRD